MVYCLIYYNFNIYSFEVMQLVICKQLLLSRKQRQRYSHNGKLIAEMINVHYSQISDTTDDSEWHLKAISAILNLSMAKTFTYLF